VPEEAEAAIPGSWSFLRLLANVIEQEETLELVTARSRPYSSS